MEALMPRKPIGERAMTAAERQARFRANRAAGKPIVRTRRPADRRRRPERWADACDTLLSILDDYQTWRDSMPAGLADSATAQRIDEVSELRDLVEQLQAAELPKGFGRD
jgi:hypothetical protein